MGVRQTDHSRGGALGRSPASAAKNSEHCSLTIVIGYGRTLHETAALRYVTYDTYRRGGFGLVCPFETAYFQSVMKAAAWRFRPSPTRESSRSRAQSFIVASLLLLCPSPVPGQSYRVQNWNIEDGLPDTRISAIGQTPDGYLWVGTPKGLARFDGTRFTIFNSASTPGLVDSRITGLLTDREGVLWVGTLDGNLARVQANQIEPVHPPVPLPVDPDPKRIPGSWAWRIHCDLVADGEGSIWWHETGKGIARLKHGSWTLFTDTNGLPRGVNQLVRDGQGKIWVEAGGKLYGFENGHWDSPQQAAPLSGKIRALAPATNGGLWVAESMSSKNSQSARIYRLADRLRDFSTFSTSLTTKPNTSGTSGFDVLHESRTGGLWFAARGGGLWHSGADGSWHSLEGQGALTDGYLTCLFEDQQGNLWVGTSQQGLYRISPHLITLLPLLPEGQRVLTVCATRDGAVWAGTDLAGVFRRSEGIFMPVAGEWDTNYPQIFSLFEDRRTNLWAGTSKGLFRLEEGSFRHSPGPLQKRGGLNVIFEDRAGCLWFGTDAGLFASDNGKFTSYSKLNRIRSIAEDSTGDLWIGTIGDGLFRLTKDRKSPPSRVMSYPASDVRTMFIERDGTFWAGSWGGGLFWGRNQVFENITAADGLPSEQITTIISDQKGNLWMGTGNGIVGIAPQTIKEHKRGESPPLLWQHLSVAQGLGNRYCTGYGQPVATETTDGQLWFPNEKQVAVLDPVKAGFKRAMPTMLVESVLADGKELPLTTGDRMRVLSGTRRFEFNYTAPDLTSGSSLRFRYKLEGMDTKWVEAGTTRVAQYSQLPPGDYEFRVMAGCNNGQWQEAGRRIAIRVVPRAWERRWVQLLTTALLVSLAGGSVTWWLRRRMQLKLERLEMERKVETERRRIARDLHDEVGSRMTRIANLGELATMEAQTDKDIKPQLVSLTSQVRELINAMDEVVWTVNPKNDSLSNLAAFVSDYTERFLAPTGISHRLELDPDYPPLSIPSQSRHHLLLAVKETLNNAVRHAAPKIIRLKIHAQSGWLELVVSDDGRGFEVEKARTGGHGLANLAERMNLIGGRAEIKSEPGKGTTVILTIPLDGHTVSFVT